MCTCGAPDIYSPITLREWLPAALRWRGMTQLELATSLNVQAPRISEYLSGRGHLTRARHEQLLEALGLCAACKAQYHAVLLLDSAQNLPDQEWARARVLEGRLREKAPRVGASTLDQMADLDGLVLRELAGICPLRRGEGHQGGLLLPPRRSSEVVDLLECMVQLGQLEQTAAGTLQPPADSAQISGPDLTAESVARIYAQMRERAGRAFDAFSASERMLQLNFLATPARLIPWVREETALLNTRIHALADDGLQRGLPARRVWGLLVQHIPLTDPVEPTAAGSPLPPTLWDPDRFSKDVEPDLYAVLDLRRYLAAWRAWHELSLEQIARKLNRHLRADGLRTTRAQVDRVLSGTIGFPPAHSHAWARVLGLDGSDQRYFLALARWQCARDPSERDAIWREELQPLRTFGGSARLDEMYFDYLSDWLVPAVRELVYHPSFRADPAWLRRAFAPTVSELDLRAALDVLIALGVLLPRPDGRLLPWPAPGISLRTEDLTREAARAVYAGAIALGDWSYHHQRGDQRMMGLTVVAVPDDLLPTLRGDIMETAALIQGRLDAALEGEPPDRNGVMHTPPEPAERVYLWSCHFFPLTRMVPTLPPREPVG